MPRKKAIIIYPKLKDRGGDLSKDWYVEFSYLVPGEIKPRRQRIHEGLSSGTAEERRSEAEKIIKAKTKWLKDGEYLNESNVMCVYEDEIMYRNEAKLYGSVKNEIVTARTNLSEFLLLKKQQINKKSYETYCSKLRLFNAFLEQKKYHTLNIRNINRSHIIEFAVELSRKGLSRLTINKYMQICYAFFEYELERGNIAKNPVEKIPSLGKVVDCAAVPFLQDERERLKAAIKSKDPQLWLACQIQFYCAIRPGTELRLMKIGWIDFENKQIRVPCVEAKNSKTEIVEIPDFLIEELKLFQVDKFDKNLYLFGKSGIPGNEPTGKNTLRNRFNRYRDELGISPEKKFYSWKHTGAISLIQNGMKPYDLKEHLRHKNFDTTEKYLKKMIKVEKKTKNFVSEI